MSISIDTVHSVARMSIRHVLGESPGKAIGRWIAVPAKDGEVRVPSVYAARNAMMRILDVDAEEAMRTEELLPTSFKQSFAWFRNAVKSGTHTLSGFDFAYGNLNGHMNFYASFLLFMEYYHDVRYHHHEAFKMYCSLLHVTRAENDSAMSLHSLAVGPPAMGKSWVLELIQTWVSQGVLRSVLFTSPKNDILPTEHSEVNTSQIETHDEANTALLGIRERTGALQARAQYATDEVATQFKQRLTQREIKAVYLSVSNDGTRKQNIIERRNDVIQVQLSNNYPNLDDPMLSRLLIIYFFSKDRLDINDSKSRGTIDRDREAKRDEFSTTNSMLYALLMEFNS